MSLLQVVWNVKERDQECVAFRALKIHILAKLCRNYYFLHEHSKNFQPSLPVLGFSIELKRLFLPVMLPLVACHKVVIYVESYPCRQKICQGIIIEMWTSNNCCQFMVVYTYKLKIALTVEYIRWKLLCKLKTFFKYLFGKSTAKGCLHFIQH